MSLPPVADLFGFLPLSPARFALAAAAGVAGVLWYELYKVVRPRDRRALV